MTPRSKWQLNREGFTIDTVGRLFDRTGLNPLLTLPLFLLSRYTKQGQALSSRHVIAFRYLRTLLLLGVMQRMADYLNDRVQNNWTDDKYDWDKEIVVVTGGSDGIGAKVVQSLAARNIKVAVIDVQPLKCECPPSVQFFECDLTSPTSIKKICESIRSTIGAPTILVNNAGVARGKTILETTERDIQLTFGVNTFSHYHLAQELVPSMVKANHGMVITVASQAAYVTAPSMVDYAASKHAALAFHEGLSAELATIYNAPKVRCVVICQGFTRTELFKGFDQGDPFVNYPLHPETVSDEIVKSILGGRSRHVMLPGLARYITMAVKGWAEFMQYGLRKRCIKLMKNWDGRQVSQPGEKKSE